MAGSLRTASAPGLLRQAERVGSWENSMERITSFVSQAEVLSRYAYVAIMHERPSGF